MKFCSAANMDCFFPSASSISFFALDLLPIELTCFATADTRWIRTKRIYSCAHFLVPTRASKSKNSSTQLAKNLALALTTQHGRSFLSNSPRPTNKNSAPENPKSRPCRKMGRRALARLFLAATEGTGERERERWHKHKTGSQEEDSSRNQISYLWPISFWQPKRFRFSHLANPGLPAMTIT
jgi:hypothetical protein